MKSQVSGFNRLAQQGVVPKGPLTARHSECNRSTYRERIERLWHRAIAAIPQRFRPTRYPSRALLAFCAMLVPIWIIVDVKYKEAVKRIEAREKAKEEASDRLAKEEEEHVDEMLRDRRKEIEGR